VQTIDVVCDHALFFAKSRSKFCSTLRVAQTKMRECPRCENCFDDAILICPEDSSNTKASLPGGTLLASRYLIKKRLGKGAMGQVYLATDQNLQTRQVAVKTVRPHLLSGEDMQEGEAIARFEREARTAASIRHPNVVDVNDFGQSPEGIFYLVMEYVQGETLHHLLRREGTLNLQRTVAVLQQIAAGVEAAHEHGILHRDLKPANVFLMKTGKTSRGDGFVKVGDFGLAKIIDDAVAENISGSGPASQGIIGTPDYMAPEQMQPGTKLGPPADIYALGTIAFHMLGGRPPFIGDLTQLIMQKMMNDPPRLSTLRTDLPADVDKAVAHALARDPAARPQTPTEWIEELSNAAEATENPTRGESRVIVMAPSGAEVYIDDLRQGSVGRSGRVILDSVQPGRHTLRVSHDVEGEDERMIEVTPDSSEQIIQAHLQHFRSNQSYTPSFPSPSQTGSGVACSNCGTKYPSGVRFCGRCGSRSLQPFQVQQAVQPASIPNQSFPGTLRCNRCQTPNPVGTKFCGKCGGPMTPLTGFGPPQSVQRVCPRCGLGLPSNARFCGRCGLSFNTP
jgi:serine/threonine protein kinase